MAQQFLLRGTTLEDASRQAAELYGPEVRIVRAERVLDGGIGGFLGRRHVEVTVHVPDDGEPAVVAVEPAIPHVLAGRAGIAALLDDADRTEDSLRAAGRPSGSAAASAASTAVRQTVSRAVSPEAVSTQAVGFDELLERLRSEVVLDERVPVPLSAPGDLVLVAGLGDTASCVARDMARDGSRWELYDASLDLGSADVGDSDSEGQPQGSLSPGLSPGSLRLGSLRLGGASLRSRRDAMAARARGVETETAVVVACSLGSVADGLPFLGLAASLGADQVWLVADARHKPEETADWVAAARAHLPVDALAVVGARETRTAHSINGLGIPVGWVDGSPAPRTVL
ncbi:hypothetical protein [Sinomonas sp. G460-2]|uniref:hypothetical protein n=1 Tax=Sinomonas sp. G460-2 TaxID=3393464 RepID=UPI0039F016F0